MPDVVRAAGEVSHVVACHSFCRCIDGFATDVMLKRHDSSLMLASGWRVRGINSFRCSSAAKGFKGMEFSPCALWFFV